MPKTRAMPDTVLGESLRLGERSSATRRQQVVFAPASLGFLDGKPRLAQKSPAARCLRVFRDVRRERHRASGRFAYERRLSRLIAATYTGGQPDEAYAYDANGNRTSANGSTYVTGADNRLISDGTYTYSYDAEGNRVARWVDANADGVLDAGDTTITVYGWDVRNRLTSVTAYATFGGDPTQIVTYVYDPEDRLIAETVDSNGDGVVDHQTYFVYDGRQIVFQFDSSSPLPSGEGQGEGVTAANLSHRYLWGPVVDQVLAGEQLSPLPLAGEGQGEGFNVSAPGNVVWPLADNLGTARDLALTDPQTGITTIANHRVYDTYGNLKSQTNAAVDYVFGFTGFLTDKATGLDMSETRPYDPRVGRWGQPDRTDLLGRDTNLSRYCNNSPTSEIDPAGLSPNTGANIAAHLAAAESEMDLLDRARFWANLLGGNVKDIIAKCGNFIKISADRLAHVMERHAAGSAAQNASKFFAKEDIRGLIEKGSRVVASPAAAGRFQRIVDAGREIGIDRTTGQATRFYTIITDRAGRMITAFPGRPGPGNN